MQGSTELRVFLCLGSLVAHNNMVYVNTGSLCDLVAVNRASLSKTLAKLKARGLIKQKEQRLPKGDRLLLVNPIYYWKGDYFVRVSYIQDWIRQQAREISKLGW